MYKTGNGKKNYFRPNLDKNLNNTLAILIESVSNMYGITDYG